MELQQIRLLAFASGPEGWSARLGKLVERHKPNVLCVLGDSLNELEASDLACLPVDSVIVSAPLTHQPKVMSMHGGACKVGPLLLIGLPCKEGTGICEMLAVGLVSPGTPGVLVWLASGGPTCETVQVVLIGTDKGKSFAAQSWRGRWGDAVSVNLTGELNVVIITFMCLAGQVLAMKVEVAL